MIDESWPWRQDLRRFASSIEAARRKPVNTDGRFARLERDHMYGFYAVRRLMECFKLSNATCQSVCRVLQYPYRTGSHLTLLNWSDLERHYEFDRGVRASLGLRDLCNQVMHSYVFLLAVGAQRRLSGIFVSSEYRRRRSLAYLPAWRTVRLFRRVAADWPNTSIGHFDDAKGDFVLSLRTKR